MKFKLEIKLGNIGMEDAGSLNHALQMTGLELIQLFGMDNPINSSGTWGFIKSATGETVGQWELKNEL